MTDQHQHQQFTGLAAAEAVARLSAFTGFAGQVTTDPRRIARLMASHDPAIYPGACRTCGQVTHLEGDGLCFPCYAKSPHRIIVRAENLAAQLADPPAWLSGFADYLVPAITPPQPVR